MRHASAIRDHLKAVEAVQTRPTTANAFHIRVRSRVYVGRSLERASIGAGEHVPVVRARQLRTGEPERQVRLDYAGEHGGALL